MKYNAEILAEMVQTERTDAIAEYEKCRNEVERLESELEKAQDALDIAEDTLKCMNIVEYK
jgi:hypothetical protein